MSAKNSANTMQVGKLELKLVLEYGATERLIIAKELVFMEDFSSLQMSHHCHNHHTFAYSKGIKKQRFDLVSTGCPLGAFVSRWLLPSG